MSPGWAPGGRRDLGLKLGVQFSLARWLAAAGGILGGLTSVPGAIVGGLIIGVGEKNYRRSIPEPLRDRRRHRDLVLPTCWRLIFLLFRAARTVRRKKIIDRV